MSKRRTAIGVTVAAALTAAALITFAVTRSNSGQSADESVRLKSVDEPTAPTGQPTSELDDVTPILTQPGTRTADVTADTNIRLGRAALATSGQGVLYDLRFPQPPNGQRLWLWLNTDTNASAVPVGPLDLDADVTNITITDDASDVSGLVFTMEMSNLTPNDPRNIVASATF
jgi:hypothetical protein